MHESGRCGEAVAAAREAASAMPDDVPVVENFVAALLSAGEPAEAVPVIERFRARSPLDQRWNTYRIDAARQLGEPLFASGAMSNASCGPTTCRRRPALRVSRSSMPRCGR